MELCSALYPEILGLPVVFGHLASGLDYDMLKPASLQYLGFDAPAQVVRPRLVPPHVCAFLPRHPHLPAPSLMSALPRVRASSHLAQRTTTLKCFVPVACHGLWKRCEGDEFVDDQS